MTRQIPTPLLAFFFFSSTDKTRFKDINKIIKKNGPLVITFLVIYENYITLN